MTQKELLESLLVEIKHIKTHMPNGELKTVVKNQEEMKEDISELKYLLLNPEDGVVVKTNANTDYRRELQNNEKEFRNKLAEIDKLKSWKLGVNRALWILFGIVASVIVRMLMMIKEV